MCFNRMYACVCIYVCMYICVCVYIYASCQHINRYDPHAVTHTHTHTHTYTE